MQEVGPVRCTEGARPDEAVDGGPHRHGTGADDEAVVPERLLAAIRATQPDPVGGHVDAGGHRVQAQLHPRRLEVGVATVGQVVPIGHLPRHVIRDAADGEVGVGVGDDDGHFGAGVKLAGAEGR